MRYNHSQADKIDLKLDQQIPESELSCIICARSFKKVTPSKEHIIPNALGGRLTTKSSTCIECNSSSGHGGNTYLVKKFQLLANSLDVIRDRGDHPNARFIDPTNGIEYILRPSKKPLRAPSLKVDRIGSKINIEFFAPTREEANKILKNQLKTDRWETPPNLEYSEQPKSNFTMNLGYSADDINILREIAKIAVYYARHIGLSINETEPTLKFSMGEDIDKCPVTPVQGNVVLIKDLPNNPLYHGIFLNRSQKNQKIYIYVFLFQFCEFLVEFQLNYDDSDFSSGYLINLVSGISEKREFEWHLSSVMAKDWFSNRKIEPSHFAERMKSIEYYFKHREQLWLDRALLIGMNHYYQILKQSNSKEKATNKAWKEANHILERYNMKLDKFKITNENEVK